MDADRPRYRRRDHDDDIESANLDDNRISRIADELNIVANQNVSALAPCEDVGAGAADQLIVA